MPAYPAAASALRSFRVQTSLLFGGLAVLLCSALALSLSAMLSSEGRSDKGRSLEVMAQVAARTLADGMAQRYREMRSLAGAEDLWRDGLDSPQAAHALQRSRAMTPQSAWIGAAGPDGVVRVATQGLLVGQSVASRPWFEQGLLGGHVGDVHPAKLLASLLPPPVSGEPLRFVDFSAPITIDGKLQGVLGVHGTWEWAREVVESLLPEDAARRSLAFFIFDKAGQVLYAPPGAALPDPALRERLPRLHTAIETGAGAGTVGLATWADAQDYLTATARVTTPAGARDAPIDLGWTVAVREPAALAFAPSRQSARRALAVGLMVALIAGALAWLASGLLSRPLAAVAHAAQDVERGVPGARIPLLGHNRELQRLTLALAGMTSRLQSTNDALEERVRQRTDELRHANLELERANGELHEMARHDVLTGLPNRRAFDEYFERAGSLARRTGTPLSLLAVDADHFKRVNDRHGHEAGDVALQRIAQALGSRLRESDVVARVGGEEFVAILPATDAEGARRLAEALVEIVAQTEIPAVGRLTISIGIATAVSSDELGASLMRRADKALYRAKSSGRNRACADGVEGDGEPPARAAIERADAVRSI